MRQTAVGRWTRERSVFVTVRLLEGVVALGVVGTVYDIYLFCARARAYQGSDGTEPYRVSAVDLLVQLSSAGGFYGFGPQPVVLVVLAALLLATVGTLHWAAPVPHARLLRWETAVLWGFVAGLAVTCLTGVLVGIARGDIERPPEDIVAPDQGPGYVESLLGNLAVPLMAVLLLGIAALWWLRLPQESDDEPETDDVDEGAGAGSAAASARAEPAARRDDDRLPDHVEVIEPVERVTPLGHGDGGGTSNGYEDYFRRF